MDESSFYKQNTLPDIHFEESRLPIPQKIGPYKIESLLNKGGMSLLYLGLHPESNQALAIKVLSPKYVTHPEMIERFLKEAHIIALTNHPNIVKLYGEGEWEGGLYIAMELIHGISLRQFILQQSLSLKRTLDIILQVAYALLHLHTHGVIHRDLKPENILITEEGEIKVIDFGIAQLHEEPEPKVVKEQSSFMGTPHYMSPEQKENPLSVSFSTDIYSLGIITYELILGRLSYGVINLTFLPKGLRKIVNKALALSPKERYQDIVDFITDISQYLKSGEWEKERPESDQLKEVLEVLQKSSLSLSPSSVPEWTQMDVGLAKHKGFGALGLYYDFFKLPNNTFLIFLSLSYAQEIEAALDIGMLRGMIRTLIQGKNLTPDDSFRLLPFVTTLNNLISADHLDKSFALQALHLDPLSEQLAFISCGLGSLFHLAAGSKEPRRLSKQNLGLGLEVQAPLFETVDNWNVGDTLILQSLALPNSPKSPPNEETEIQISKALADSIFLSAQGQADAILKQASLTPSFSLQKYPKVVLSIQRIT